MSTPSEVPALPLDDPVASSQGAPPVAPTQEVPSSTPVAMTSIIDCVGQLLSTQPFDASMRPSLLPLLAPDLMHAKDQIMTVYRDKLSLISQKAALVESRDSLVILEVNVCHSLISSYTDFISVRQKFR